MTITSKEYAVAEAIIEHPDARFEMKDKEVICRLEFPPAILFITWHEARLSLVIDDEEAACEDGYSGHVTYRLTNLSSNEIGALFLRASVAMKNQRRREREAARNEAAAALDRLYGRLLKNGRIAEEAPR